MIDDVNIQIDSVHQMILTANDDLTIDIHCIFNNSANNVLLSNQPLYLDTPHSYKINNNNHITLSIDRALYNNSYSTYGDIVINPRLNISTPDYQCFILYPELSTSTFVRNISSANGQFKFCVQTPINDYQLSHNRETIVTDTDNVSWYSSISQQFNNEVVELWIKKNGLDSTGMCYDIIDIQYSESSATQHQYINCAEMNNITPYDIVCVDKHFPTASSVAYNEVATTTTLPYSYTFTETVPPSNTYQISGAIKHVDQYGFIYGVYADVLYDIATNEIIQKCDKPHSLVTSIDKCIINVKCQYKDRNMFVHPSHYMIQLFDSYNNLVGTEFFSLGVRVGDIYTNSISFIDASLWGYDYTIKVYMYQTEGNVVSDECIESDAMEMYYFDDVDLTTMYQSTFTDNENIYLTQGFTSVVLGTYQMNAFCNREKAYVDFKGFTVNTRVHQGISPDFENKILYCNRINFRNITSVPNIEFFNNSKHGFLINCFDTKRNKYCIAFGVGEDATFISALPLNTRASLS